MSTYPANSAIPTHQRVTLRDLRDGQPPPALVESPRLNRFTARQRAHALWSIRQPIRNWTPHPHRQREPKGPVVVEESSNA